MSLMEQRKNIILIGMPGCGKTTIGQMLAEALQMTFVDMDQAIEADAKTTIPKIFVLQGEAAFRQMETAKARELGQQTNLVISTGGGVVTREANMEALGNTGLVIFLDRPLEQILAGQPGNADNSRPLLAKDREANLRRLYQERIGLYETYGHICIVNDTTAEAAVEKILQKIKEVGGYTP